MKHLGVWLFAAMITSYFWLRASLVNPIAAISFEVWYIIASMLGLWGFVFAGRRYGWRNAHGKALLWIGVGLVFWFLGEVMWAVNELIFGIDPFPSLADVFYLLGYPFLLIGLVKEFMQARINIIETFKKPIILFVLLVSAVLIAIIVNFGVLGAVDPSASMIENALLMAYGFGDLVLVIGGIIVVLVVHEYGSGKLYEPWLYVVAGLTTTVIADVIFGFYYDEYMEMIWPYIGLDLLWIVSYLLIGTGGFRLGTIIYDVARSKLKQSQ